MEAKRKDLICVMLTSGDVETIKMEVSNGCGKNSSREQKKEVP